MPHLLLVEDNIIALRLLESLSQQAGCEFTSTLDAEKALELAKTTLFDLIITDIGLPGMSGIEMTIYIRHWERETNSKSTPIVGLTAHSLASSVDECMEAGMDKVFAKPINFQTMKDIVTTLISPPPNVDIPPPQELPTEESELFALDKFPVFNAEQGMSNLGNLALLEELLNLMIDEVIPKDEEEIAQAYKKQDWESIEKLAHKMKSGALYCGTIRWQYACHYLERYGSTGQSKFLDRLYLQLMQVLKETKSEIAAWLKSKNAQR